MSRWIRTLFSWAWRCRNDFGCQKVTHKRNSNNHGETGPFPPKSLLVLLGAVLAALPGAWQAAPRLGGCFRIWCFVPGCHLPSGLEARALRWNTGWFVLRNCAEGQQMGEFVSILLFLFFFLYYQNYSVAVCKVTQSCLGFS